MYLVGEGYRQSAALVTWSKDDWSWSTHGNLLNYGRRWLKSLWVKSVQKRHSYVLETSSAHDLSVKLSACVCSYSSCPGWRNDWHMHQTFSSAPGTVMHYDCVYMHRFNLVVSTPTAKLPNLIPHQIFQLCGKLLIMYAILLVAWKRLPESDQNFAKIKICQL